MHYSGAHPQAELVARTGWLPRAWAFVPKPPSKLDGWACSLFAALGDAENRLYGRNFDWEHSPALLVFTDPPEGYASVSVVDIAYLGFQGERSQALLELSLVDRAALLSASTMPFDGMNERGLVVGMTAVPPGGMRPDPEKQTIDSLGIIWQILDQASNIEEAIALFQKYNIDFEGGPPIHYLLADATGQAALVEFYQGEIEILLNEKPWHLATNFLRTSVQGSAHGQCWRYDRLSQGLANGGGKLSMQEAMSLLAQVAQEGTQWSVVYGMSSGEIEIVMGRRYENMHTFAFDLAK
jgi:hypothetical protein